MQEGAGHLRDGVCAGLWLQSAEGTAAVGRGGTAGWELHLQLPMTLSSVHDLPLSWGLGEEQHVEGSEQGLPGHTQILVKDLSKFSASLSLSLPPGIMMAILPAVDRMGSLTRTCSIVTTHRTHQLASSASQDPPVFKGGLGRSELQEASVCTVLVRA